MADLPSTPGGITPMLIAVPAACAVLSIGRRTLWSLTINGAIPSYKLGRARRYDPDELRAWIRCGCPTHAGAGDEVRKWMEGGDE